VAAKPSKPFPLQLEVEFLDRLSEPVRDGKARSVSAIIRAALERYDFTDVLVMRPAQLQISVRLPVELRRLLKQTARSKHTSVGHLVRAAVEAYLPELEAAPLPEKPPAARRRRRRAKR
jgi:predicted DNA-binding protein